MNPFVAQVGDWVVSDGSDGMSHAILVTGMDCRGWLRLNGVQGRQRPDRFRLATAREIAGFRNDVRSIIDRQRASKGLERVSWQG